MGMDASVRIWVGILEKDHHLLPSDMFDEDGDVLWGQDTVAAEEKYGFSIERFRSGDEIDGYGIEVFWHDWGFGPKRFDVSNLSSEIMIAKTFWDSFNAKHGPFPTSGVYIQTDFS